MSMSLIPATRATLNQEYAQYIFLKKKVPVFGNWIRTDQAKIE